MKYYSEKTKQMYDDTAALEVAEKKYDEDHAAELALKEEKKNAAHEVEEAYKAANEAMNKANELLNAFVKKYGSYHATYTGANLPSTRSLVDAMFNSWFF